MVMELNKWQKYYIDKYYQGKIPRSISGRNEVKLLGKVKDKVTVHFPKFVSTLKSQCSEACVETYTVVLSDFDMRKGTIDVDTLLPNLILWENRGYEIEY